MRHNRLSTTPARLSTAESPEKAAVSTCWQQVAHTLSTGPRKAGLFDLLVRLRHDFPVQMGQGFVKVLLSELEGAIDRASEKSLSAQETSAVAVDGEPTEPA